MLFFHGPDLLTSSPPHPPNSGTVLRRVSSLSQCLPFFFFFLNLPCILFVYSGVNE